MGSRDGSVHDRGIVGSHKEDGWGKSLHFIYGGFGLAYPASRPVSNQDEVCNESIDEASGYYAGQPHGEHVENFQVCAKGMTEKSNGDRPSLDRYFHAKPFRQLPSSTVNLPQLVFHLPSHQSSLFYILVRWRISGSLNSMSLVMP